MGGGEKSEQKKKKKKQVQCVYNFNRSILSFEIFEILCQNVFQNITGGSHYSFKIGSLTCLF